MTTIEKIRAEIERLIQINMTKNGFPAGNICAIRIDVYNRLLSFLDTLEEPVCEDLEEAVMNYIAPIENVAGLKVINFSGQDIKDAFIAGANWEMERIDRLESGWDADFLGLLKDKMRPYMQARRYADTLETDGENGFDKDSVMVGFVAGYQIRERIKEEGK